MITRADETLDCWGFLANNIQPIRGSSSPEPRLIMLLINRRPRKNAPRDFLPMGCLWTYLWMAEAELDFCAMIVTVSSTSYITGRMQPVFGATSAWKFLHRHCASCAFTKFSPAFSWCRNKNSNAWKYQVAVDRRISSLIRYDQKRKSGLMILSCTCN